MDTRLEARKKEFKKSFDDVRRQREDNAVQIRRSAREAHLTKKRIQANEPDGMGGTGGSGGAVSDVGAPDRNLLQQYVNEVHSGNPKEQYHGVHMIRRLLSVENNPPINAVIAMGIVPRVVELMKRHDSPNMQFECEWIVTNIASGTSDDTAVVVEAGALPVLVELLDSPDITVKEQAVWALGNIAGDSPKLRNLVLAQNVLDKLLRELQNDDYHKDRITMIRYGTWTLSNLCRGKPETPIEVVNKSLPVLRRLLYIEDPDVLADACWAISYISDTSPGEGDVRINAIIMSGLCGRLVHLLEHPNFAVQAPALRSVGNIVSGEDDSHTDSILQMGVLRPLKALMRSNRKSLRREACWTVSNITGGTRQQIAAILEEGFLPILNELLECMEYEVKKEATWAIVNAISGGSTAQIEMIVASGSLQHLCGLLGLHDKKLVGMVLEAIENILKSGQKRKEKENLEENPYLTALESAGGFDSLELLQNDPVVGGVVLRIMMNFMELETDDQPVHQPFGGANAFGAAAI